MMIHPVWPSFLDRLREMLDERDLCHIVIKEETDGEPLSYLQLESKYGTTKPFLDEFVTFEPAEDTWRVYDVEGAPPDERDKWISRAKLDDFQNTPLISYSEKGQWEMSRCYDQGTLPPDEFDDELVFLHKLVDDLAVHYASRQYILDVSVQGANCSWSRQT